MTKLMHGRLLVWVLPRGAPALSEETLGKELLLPVPSFIPTSRFSLTKEKQEESAAGRAGCMRPRAGGSRASFINNYCCSYAFVCCRTCVCPSGLSWFVSPRFVFTVVVGRMKYFTLVSFL